MHVYVCMMYVCIDVFMYVCRDVELVVVIAAVRLRGTQYSSGRVYTYAIQGDIPGIKQLPILRWTHPNSSQ